MTVLRLACLAWILLACSSSLQAGLLDHLVYFPPQEHFGLCQSLRDAGGEFVATETPSGRIRYAKFEKGQRPWVLHFHGNGDSVCTRVDIALALQAQGYNVALAEYWGYGGDKKFPHHTQILEEALRLAEHIQAQAGAAGWVAMGESLGTGVATYVASRLSPTAMVLDSSYPSIGAIGAKQFPWLPARFLMRGVFTADRYAKDVRCPVLMLHGTADTLTYYELAKKHRENFKDLTWHEEAGAGHNDMVFWRREGAQQALKAFLEKHLKPRDKK